MRLALLGMGLGFPLLSWACYSSATEGLNGIKVCGQVFALDAVVLRWDQEGGYDAYSEARAFPDEVGAAKDMPVGKRYGERSANTTGTELSLTELQKHVTQFVLHYDVTGYSRQCFKVLHDRRGLSAHFLLDLDGRIYQTLDLRERAWHAGVANDRSIGIEMANVGAYGAGEDGERLKTWFRRDAQGVRVVLPVAELKSGLPSGFVARPARGELVKGVVQGRMLSQWDFTEAQYRSLGELLRVLRGLFPRIALDYPRTAGGELRRQCR